MTMRVGESTVRLIAEYGVDTAFGIPGVHNVELYRGLPETPIRHVLARHEQGAAFMADGYARATGRPALCLLISGPGVTNALTAMCQARSDSVPMLVVASGLPPRTTGRGFGRLHEAADQRGAAAVGAPLAVAVQNPEEIPGAIAAAFQAFAVRRPAPAYVEIPLDLLGEPAPGGWRPVALPAPPAPDADAITQAARVLERAEAPLILAGGGAVGAADRLTALAEALDAPVIATQAGKGIVDDDHPLAAGACLISDEGQAFLSEADAVLAVGTEFSETDCWGQQVSLGGTLVRIDIDPDRFSDDQGADVPVLADARLAVAALAEACVAKTERRAAQRVAAFRDRLRAAEPPEWRPRRRALEALHAAIPKDSIVPNDMTQIAYAGGPIFPAHVPRSWLHPAGYATLGYAIPGAIGAKLGAPERPVVALMGDYGAQYTSNELATAVELRLPIPFVVWNNSALAEIRDDMERKGIAPNAVEALNPDFQKLGAAYGMATHKPGGLGTFSDAVAGALAADGPTLIELTPEAAERD
jgi:thiamine pyrophosphate-dependent acetolactate synthase large subunit-like protein